jgi:DNA polymerase-3 subunit epsilon
MTDQSSWYCLRCGNQNDVIGELCFRCEARAAAIRWSRRLLEASSFVILDTETSGLMPGHHEIVQIAAIAPDGSPLLDTYVQPQYPERLTERTNGRSASDINGITPDMLTTSPAWPTVAAQLWPLLAGKTTVIYNAEYDLSMIVGDCERAALEMPAFTPKCAMRAYAKFYGDWSDYWGNFRWQPLNGGHTALSDCLATLALIQSMAAAND